MASGVCVLVCTFGVDTFIVLRFVQALLITSFLAHWASCCCPAGAATHVTARSPPTRVAAVTRVGMGPVHVSFAAAHPPFLPTKYSKKQNCFSLA